MENIILVSGCSFTHEHFIPTWAQDTEFASEYKNKIWPEYINKNNINLAISGYGNDEAIWSVIYFLEKNNTKNISKVFIALTDWCRFMIPSKIALRIDLFNQWSINDKKMAKEKLWGSKYKYIEGYDKSESKYNLCGIIEHIGGINGGHYISHNINSNGKWYTYNDDTVTEISVNNLQDKQAYILCYIKNN